VTNPDRHAQARQFYLRAIQQDPDFALAHARLSLNYGNANLPELAAESAARAFALRERTSEPERLEIVVRYHTYVTGNVHEVLAAATLWKTTYPREPMAWNMSAVAQSQLGNPARAIEELSEVIRLDQTSPSPT
jgi:tetratricopeptide (TPR) repeat protein